ncbi:uncharacterized protein LOC117578521 isoform X1 [Drosophila guanche]|uniref:Uncharacterized protein n=2 Tax=Drosophila guanche TaxID=7266 RepID=A0A3B0J2E1_DROGU|nr:uncharacterized protein LOC117578521 isoform X1 [Drosophila guanche]SPP75297.1 Hypothetical predicted protein [Drosophila guanche]
MAGSKKDINTADAEMDNHLRCIFYIKPKPAPTKCSPFVVEFFGVLSLTDLREPERKLWYIYYCKQSDIEHTVHQIHQKYGKKNMYEIFQKPVFSGAALRASVKKHFAELKWFTKGNLLEAPPKSHFNNERVCKTVTDLRNIEQQRIYNYVLVKSQWYSMYNR